MCPLQMKATGAKISDLHHRVLAKALLDCRAPLLNVLRRRIRLHPGETYDRRSEHSWSKVECLDGWGKVVALIGFRKGVRNIVPLVTPGVHVHWSEEDSGGDVEHQPSSRKALGDAETWREVCTVR